MTLHTYNIRGMIYCECSRLFSYCCTYTDAVIERERQSAAVAAAAEFALVADQAENQPQQHRPFAPAAGYIHQTIMFNFFLIVIIRIIAFY